MPLSGGVTFRAATPGATRACQKPAKRRRGTRHFCDVFLQRLQTNPPVIDGSTKSWNVGGVTTSPETVRRLMQPGGPSGVSAPPQGPHHHARRRPGRAPRPDRKELHSRCTSSGNWWTTITHMLLTREGFVYPAGRDGAAYSKRIVGYAMAEHMRTELAQNALQNWRLGTASPSRV